MNSTTIVCISLLLVPTASAQFRDDFTGDSTVLRSGDSHGWTFRTGDGSATMEFHRSGRGYASVWVDATSDTRGIWWALIRRRVSDAMDVSRLKVPGNGLRIEARIRVSHAPRRVNLHLNTQRTTDFHSHLMEFDIPDTSQWHTISMTTKHFDAVPGDSVYGQLALMDWGLERYRVDLDYFSVDIVNVDSAGPDKGVPVPYHPPVPATGTFDYHLPVAQDAMIDSDHPELAFPRWSTADEQGRVRVLTVSGSQLVILRWDLSAYVGRKVAGSGVLGLTTVALQRSPEHVKDFGMVRITEITGGDPRWSQEHVSWSTFCQGNPLTSVLNPQMIIDVDVAERRGDTTLATISNPVLQRMIDGKTLGLAIRPLGAVIASFYAMEHGTRSATLHFTLESTAPVPTRPDR